MRGEDAGSQLRNALGALKDTLGAVANLDELLRSPRVAPKAVSAVLPDMAATLPALQKELEAARPVLADRFGTSAVAEVCAFIVGEVDGLALALGEATPNQRALNASTRLALERKVDKLRQRLLGALPLWELLVELWSEPGMPIDVHELLVLMREGDQSHGLRGESVPVTLDARQVPVWLQCSPRALLTLIAVAAALTREHALGTGVTVQLGTDPSSGRAELALEPSNPATPLFSLVVPPVVAPTRACFEAAARVVGVEATVEGPRVRLAWGAPTPP